MESHLFSALAMDLAFLFLIKIFEEALSPWAGFEPQCREGGTKEEGFTFMTG